MHEREEPSPVRTGRGVFRPLRFRRFAVAMFSATHEQPAEAAQGSRTIERQATAPEGEELFYQQVHPPSTTRFAPVMYDDASLARKMRAPM